MENKKEKLPEIKESALGWEVENVQSIYVIIHTYTCVNDEMMS